MDDAIAGAVGAEGARSSPTDSVTPGMRQRMHQNLLVQGQHVYRRTKDEEDDDVSESTIVLTKDQRVNLINRRSVAWILEFIPIYVVSTLVLSLISASELLAWLILAVWLAVRDLWGASWGKKLVGLDVAPIDDASREVSPGSRVLRNVPLMVPLVPIVEFFVAYLGSDPQMKRIGDRLAGTRIVDRFPDTRGRGSWSGMLILALVVAGGAQYALKRLLGGP